MKQNVPSNLTASTVEILLIGAGFDTGNLGVAALASGTMASVLTSFPDAKISLLDYGREAKVYDFQYGDRCCKVELVHIRFSKRLFLPNNIARLLITAICLRFFPFAAREDFLRKNRWLQAVDRADIVAAISGGDSFSDIYGLRRLLYVTLPQLLVLALRKPLVLLPQTYGPFKGRLARLIAGYVIKRAYRIFSRDVGGLEVVNDLTGYSSPRAKFSYDMGFALEPRTPPKAMIESLLSFKDGHPLVGLNLSGLLYVGGYTGSNMFGLKTDYRQLLLRIIELFARRFDCNVLLIPHVFGQENESDTAASLDFWRNLSPELKRRVHCLEGPADHHQIKFIIGQCDFFLGSRMHACIAALSQCVPSVALAYSDKFLGVMRSIELDMVVADLRQQDEAEVIKRLIAVYNRRGEIRDKLETKMPEVKRSVLGLFSQLLAHPKQTLSVAEPA